MIEVKWDNPEKNIVVWKFSSPWTWEEFFAAKNEVDTMIDGVDGIVDSIFLTSEAQSIPSNAIATFRNILAKRHPRHDSIVLVGAKDFLTKLLNLVIQFLPDARHQVYFVSLQTDAYHVIEQARQQRGAVTPRGTS
ncbi:MAG: hypothetical protein KJ065_18765 [Anaerolineae bacterium]|nr:hypothetical protein [Anaerolineae bacterium]